MGKKLTKRDEDYSRWYNELVVKADLAENSSVRGCMVIKPYGYAIWEKMQKQLDQMFKDTGHQNAYFPLFVPKSLFEAEEKNAEGFAKECAIVTHYRLKNDTNNPGKLIVDEKAKLEEELIVRPTSEAIIWNTYKNWIQSYRDLPILINQWANVVRWEMRTRLFLRTAEFLWQEGHTAHETKNEAVKEAVQMNDIYAEFAESYMGIPVLKGIKSESERFAGAEETYCIEALMQDGKALQAGTSHFLGQNFAKAFDVKYANKNGDLDYVWATSWGVSTRLMGALIMTHSDDNGLVLPPNLAPVQVVLIPIYRSDEDFDLVCKYLNPVITELKSKGISVLFDKRDTYKPGYKFNEHEIKGVPIRIVAGPKDIENSTLEIFRRDKMEKEIVDIKNISSKVDFLIEDIQKHLFEKAKNFTDANTRKANSYKEFKELIKNEGGFISAHWDGTRESEEKIKRETKATIRLIPIDGVKEKGNCIYSNKPSNQRVLFAKAY
ncbi:MAG: proline--tRNA ligase [Flavobacteriaceae bacterium]|nr:proline--tRNA ligase [Flavobacteriaceae bacterium]